MRSTRSTLRGLCQSSIGGSSTFSASPRLGVFRSKLGASAMRASSSAVENPMKSGNRRVPEVTTCLMHVIVVIDQLPGVGSASARHLLHRRSHPPRPDRRGERGETQARAFTRSRRARSRKRGSPLEVPSRSSAHVREMSMRAPDSRMAPLKRLVSASSGLGARLANTNPREPASSQPMRQFLAKLVIVRSTEVVWRPGEVIS